MKTLKTAVLESCWPGQTSPNANPHFRYSWPN